MVPGAVGRTAVAVGGLADSGLVLQLTRSRGWIGVLGTLLVGIVALNVMALSFNASSSKTAGISDEIRRDNSALRAEIADGLSNEHLQNAAARLGLVMPEAAATLMLTPGADDAAAAAKRLRDGDITLGSSYVPPAPPAPVPAAADPVIPIDPATTVDPSTTVPTAPVAIPDPATTAAVPAADDGGGITP